MKFIDLFAGIGGFHYGVTRAMPGSECVYSSEWDKYANSVYRRHYGKCDNRDIRTVKSEEIPDFDLLTGGFPCQSFSIAGKRGGFNDTRGTLFFEIARILREKQPGLFLLENVKGLLSHDNGRTFKIILTTLTELGYDVQWQVLNSKNFGVPQNRERVFIVGNIRGSGGRKIFPITESIGLDNGEKQIVSTAIDTNYWKGADKHGQRTMIEITKGVSDAQRIYESNGIGKTLKGLGGGLGAKTGLYSVDHRIRRLTPIECERLQGFPDNWTQYGADGKLISDTQRYKMCENAVTTKVIESIIRCLPIDNV